MSDFNMAALDSFNRAISDNDNAIVNVDRENNNRLKYNGTFRSANIFRWMRSPATKAANNEVRTQLLKSLGEAYGLNGMTTRSDGKVKFSQDFINDLRNRLGAELKIEDFGINRDGLVTSGRPLTVRRIKEIIAKASGPDLNVRTDSNVNTSASNLIINTASSGSESDFDINSYKNKLNEAFKKMGDLNGITGAQQCLSFLEKLGSNPLVREDPDYDFLCVTSNDEEEREKLVRFQYYDVNQQKYVPMKRIDDLANYLNDKDTLGMPIHLESQPFRPQNYKEGDKHGPEAMEKYVKHHITEYVRLVADLYYDCKKAGKLNDYESKMRYPGGCLEARLTNASEFKEKLGVTELSDNEVDNVRDMQRLADTGEKVPLHNCIFAELNAIISDPNAEQGDDWNAYADRVKKNLCGKKHPITEIYVNEQGQTAYRPVMQNGKPLVREITAQDLDEIGPKIYESIYE
ncbi:hypothetical protein [Succinimonas sp.]|uniref:hypothetical protein n=1 Tax=Succinimonas sp. TaxID=1936151 RepID=UPI00386AA044